MEFFFIFGPTILKHSNTGSIFVATSIQQLIVVGSACFANMCKNYTAALLLVAIGVACQHEFCEEADGGSCISKKLVRALSSTIWVFLTIFEM